MNDTTVPGVGVCRYCDASAVPDGCWGSPIEDEICLGCGAPVYELLRRPKTTIWNCLRCNKVLGVAEERDDQETRVAMAICREFGNEWAESTITSAGCYGDCPYLPGRDDWRRMAREAIGTMFQERQP